MKKTYHGSCHCGAVRFECDLDLSPDQHIDGFVGGTRRCNCSYCLKTRMWKAFALKGDFRLIEGADRLSDYRAPNSNWPEGDIHHYFCSRCGVRGFSKGFLAFPPFDGEFHAVNVATLDDATDEEFAGAPIIYEDGRNDVFDKPPNVHSYL